MEHPVIWIGIAVSIAILIYLGTHIPAFNKRRRAVAIMRATFGPSLEMAEFEYSEATNTDDLRGLGSAPKREFPQSVWMSDHSLGFFYEVANRAALLAFNHKNESPDNAFVASTFLHEMRGVPLKPTAARFFSLWRRPTDDFEAGRASGREYLHVAARYPDDMRMLRATFAETLALPLVRIARNRDVES